MSLSASWGPTLFYNARIANGVRGIDAEFQSWSILSSVNENQQKEVNGKYSQPFKIHLKANERMQAASNYIVIEQERHVLKVRKDRMLLKIGILKNAIHWILISY